MWWSDPGHSHLLVTRGPAVPVCLGQLTVGGGIVTQECPFFCFELNPRGSPSLKSERPFQPNWGRGNFPGKGASEEHLGGLSMWARVMRQGLEAVRQEPGAAGSFGDSRLPQAPEVSWVEPRTGIQWLPGLHGQVIYGIQYKMPPFGKQDKTFSVSVHLSWHIMTFLSCGALDSKVPPLTGVRESTEDRVAIITMWKKSSVGDTLSPFLFL